MESVSIEEMIAEREPNFAKKIRALAEDIVPYKEEQEFYTKLALRTFTSYEQIVKKLYHNESYFVSNTKSVKNSLFNSLAKKDNCDRPHAPEVDSPYFSEIFKEQIHLVEERRLELSYFFVVSEPQLVTYKVLQKLSELSKIIPVKIVENLHPHYEEIILPQNENFILYKTYNDEGNYLP